MEYQLTTNWSWVVKAICKYRDVLIQTNGWRDAQISMKYSTSAIYCDLHVSGIDMP